VNSARRQGRTPEQAPRTLKILIVEDNPEDAEIFAEFLTLRAYALL